FLLVRHLDAHRTRTDAGQQRHVAGQDAEFAAFARQSDELRESGEDLLFRADDVDVNSHGHGVSLCPSGRRRGAARRYQSFLAFGMASSLPPRMQKACSGMWSHSRETSILKPALASVSGTSLPGAPVTPSATWKGCARKRWILR